LSISRGYLIMWSDAVVGDRRGIASLVSWSAFLSLYTFGAVFVLGGLGLQLLRREWMIPLYAFIYMAALCMTPFRAQFPRYLMPIAPLLALSLVVSVTAIRDSCRHSPGSSWARLGRRGVGILIALALLAELVCFAAVYASEHGRVSYVDRNGQLVAYRLFYYTNSYRGFDQSIDFVRRRAARTDVIAAGMPHWVYLRTGLKSVMPPFEHDAAKTQDLLDSVPVTYMIIGRDVVDSQRYTLPVVWQFSAEWKEIYVTPAGDWTVYQRVNRVSD
jgi:hypothetical protein